MIDALKYIQSHHPDVYARTKYRIVEISPQLAQRQTERAKRAGVEESVEIVQIDIFKWNGGGVEPCYVVALEVLVRQPILSLFRNAEWCDCVGQLCT